MAMDYHERQRTQAIERLVGEFVEERGDTYEEFVHQLVDVKCNYLGGAPDQWPPAHVTEVLLTIYPAKIMLEPEDLTEVPQATAEFLRFLAGRFPDLADNIETLADSVAGATTQFVSAMSDENNWGFGRRIWTTAKAEGVVLGDQASMDAWMDAWMDAFNQRPRAERDQVLGPTAYPPEAMGKRPPFLPVALPTDDELEQALTRAPFLYQLIGLVDYIGKGKALTQTGNLKLVDGKELVEVLRTCDRVDEWIGDKQFKTRSSADLGGLDLVFQVALDAKLLKRRRTGNKVVPGPKVHLARQPTLKLADAAFRSLIFDVGPSRHLNRIDPYGCGWFAESLDEQLPDMLLYLYVEQNDEVEELAARAWEVLNNQYDLSDLSDDRADFHRRLVLRDLRCVVHQLAELGVVRVFDEEVSEVSFGREEVAGGWVEMDVLGWRLVHQLAAEVAEAPVIGGLRDLDAADLLRAAADLPDTEARAEIDHWLYAGGASAVGRLADALIDAPPTERSLAYHGLWRSGTAALVAFNERPALADVATIFAVDMQLVPVTDVSREDNPEGWVALLALVIDFWGPEAAATAWASQTTGLTPISTMLDRAWRVPGEDTETVLGAIASSHPDKSVAKAASKALFKFRSAR